MATQQGPSLHTVKDISNVQIIPKDSLNENVDHSDGKIHGNALNDKSIDTNFQPGVQMVEAITITWTATALITAYIVMWFIYFVQGLALGVSAALVPYVTSDFAQHSLIPTTGVLSQVIGGVTNLGVAKVLDIFGRPHGFLLCAFFCTVGLIMSAACQNVETYAASQVFYTIGINGIGYSLSVFIADTSSLRHRGLMQSLLNSPYLITSWLGGPISTAFLNGAGWRWAFGMESILVPAVTLPLFGLFMYHHMNAKKHGIAPQGTRKTTSQSIMYYAHEFDLVGLLLICAGIAFFLLPFNLYAQQQKGWKSAIVICFLVFGILLIIAFVVWERFFARVSLTPWAILKDRTVLGTCILAFALFTSTACWNGFLSSYLQVVNGLSVTKSSYVIQGAAVGAFLSGIAAGVIISWTGNYKKISLFLAFPLIVLGTGLMIHFLNLDQSVGFIVMCQLFIQFGFGILMLTVEIGILAAVSEQQYFAIGIAVLNLFAYIGTAVGLSISAAIWQGNFPEKLAVYLPAEAQGNLTTIYGDITAQLSYDIGSPERMGIQSAYRDTFRYLLIAGVSAWVIGLPAILIWKDMNVKGIKQNKGQVV